MPSAPSDSLPSADTVRPIDLTAIPDEKRYWHVAAGIAGGLLAASGVAWMLDSARAAYVAAFAVILFALSVLVRRRDVVGLRFTLAVASTIAAAIPIALVVGMYELRRVLVLETLFLPAAVVTIVFYVRTLRWVDDDVNVLRHIFGGFVGEWEGVQFAMLFPKGRIEVATKVWAVVQNATDAKRSIELYLEERGDRASLLMPERVPFDLEAGECAVLVADVGVAATARDLAQLHGAMLVAPVEGVGSRLLRWKAPDVAPRTFGQARRADPDKLFGVVGLYGGHTISINPAAGHALDPTSLHVRMYPMSPADLAEEFGVARPDLARWG